MIYMSSAAMVCALRMPGAGKIHHEALRTECAQSWGPSACQIPKTSRHGLCRNVSKKASRVILELLTVQRDNPRFRIAVRRTRKHGRSLQVEITQELINIGELEVAHAVSISLRKFWLTRPPVDVLAALVASLLKTKQENLAESICNLVNQQDGNIDSEPSSSIRVEFHKALLTACAARGLHLNDDTCLPVNMRDNFDMLDQGVEAEGKDDVEATEMRLEEVILEVRAASSAENKGVVDDSHRYIRALRIGGQFVQALAVHAQLLEEGSEESYALCKELMLLYASMGNVAGIDQVLEKMERSGFMEGSHRYDTVVRVYVKLKQVVKLTDLVPRIASGSVSVQIISSILCFLQCAEVIDGVLQTSYRDKLELVHDTQVTSPNFEKLEKDLEAALHQHAETVTNGGGNLLGSIWAYGIPQSCVSWQADCWSLDLHGAHPMAAKVLLVRWLAATSQLRVQSNMTSDCEVITGWGKHSRMAGQSRVKQEVLQILQSWESPFKVDSGNPGKLVARGWILNHWLGLERVVGRD